jgi:hypothetical protein
MRIVTRLSGGAVWAVLVAASAGWTQGAEVDRVQPVPLGGSLANQSGDRHFGVYVPTRFGGTLSVKATAGTVGPLTGPDGRERPNGQDAPDAPQGWYTFKVSGAEKPYTVEARFEQVGQASRMPWNFYYWPTKGDCVHEPWDGYNGRVDTPGPYGDDVQVVPFGSYVAPGQDIILPGANGLLETPPAPGDHSTWFPNEYDDLNWRGGDGTWYNTPAPMLKYDQLFGTSARNWEAVNSQNQDIQRWPGHCLGGAIASISMNEPVPAPGSGLTQDELKALWAELGENHYNHRIGDNVNNIPAGPPRPGYDPTDAFVPRFHAMLEHHIRARRQALLGNLRGFPPTGKPNEVWNHGIGKYTAKYHAVPGQNPRVVRIELELLGNSGSNLNNSDNKPRVNTYEYILTYNVAGDIDETGAGFADWLGLGGEAMYAPLNIMEVLSSQWQGHNPMITEANVRSLDLANGGTGSRFAYGSPPAFRPVGAYEAGRPSYAGFFSRGRNRGANEPLGADGMAGGLPAQPRRGLFRIFGR